MRLSTNFILPAILLALVAMMVLPIPAWLLDVGVSASFAIAILLLATVCLIERPLDFSSFPSILLATLVLRLSLNISSTKLIISSGHNGTDAAGDVIEGFASFVMAGNTMLGLVIFSILLIVNFVVITKGATRMAEVGARFALDGMPGKQLAIDSDVAAGAITHEEAILRRENEQQETAFFGSLDGASKFVKGDAIAGLLITLLNLVVGLSLGVFVHDMSFSHAFDTYAILTVGDGLVTQIPALIISVSAALLLARGGARQSTEVEIVKQIRSYPIASVTVAAFLALFAIVPGLPFLPFLFGSILFALIALRLLRSPQIIDHGQEDYVESEPIESTMGDVLDLDDVHIVFSGDLVPHVLDPVTGLEPRIANMRNHVATNFGLVVPEIRMTDDPTLSPGTYKILVFGVESARASLNPDMVLALVNDKTMIGAPGLDVDEPVYGAPARWVQPEMQEKLSMDGVTIISPTEVLATHLLEVLKKNLGRLLTTKSLRRILQELVDLSTPERGRANRELLDEMIPDRVPFELLHAVLRLLLDEQVSIRNIPLILEAISEARSESNQPEAICEYVRQRLGFQIISELKRVDGTIPLIQFAPQWEEAFSAYQVDGGRGALDVALPPDVFSKLSDVASNKAQEVSSRGINAAFVTSSKRRRFLKTVLSARGLPNPVLSFEEIGFDAQPALVGVVDA